MNIKLGVLTHQVLIIATYLRKDGRHALSAEGASVAHQRQAHARQVRPDLVHSLRGCGVWGLAVAAVKTCEDRRHKGTETRPVLGLARTSDQISRSDVYTARAS